MAGAAIGAVVGGLIGKGVAEKIDPTREDAYWRENHPRQGWAKGRSYDEFSPAYRVGYEGCGRVRQRPVQHLAQETCGLQAPVAGGRLV